MVLDKEPLGCQLFHGTGAGVDREHAIAAVAVEVVMVVPGFVMADFAKRFKARGLTRQIDTHDLAAFEQFLQLPIDRGKIQPGHRLLSQFANRRRSQWPVAVCQCGEDCVALPCVAFHSQEFIANRFAISAKTRERLKAPPMEPEKPGPRRRCRPHRQVVEFRT